MDATERIEQLEATVEELRRELRELRDAVGTAGSGPEGASASGGGAVNRRRRAPTIEILTSSLSGLAESPIWDVEEQRLYWIDNAEGHVFRCTADGREVAVWPVGGHITSIAPRTRGGVIVTIDSAFYEVDLATSEKKVLFDVESGPGFGFNDGKVDRQGRFVSGLVEKALIDPSWRSRAGSIDTKGRLYRLDHDGTAKLLAEGIGISNGPCFSPDGTTMYWGDSWPGRVYAFDYDTASGVAGDRRVFASFEGGLEVPDGSTVDEDGYVWVCVFAGHEIRRYAPDGALDRRIPMPVPSPTSVSFGGPDLDILFVSSAGAAPVPGRAVTQHPLGGCMFTIRGLGVRGVPERRFAG